MTALHAERPSRSEIVRRNIRAEAARRGWTQSQLAALVGIERASVSHRYVGRTDWSVDEIDTIATAMGIPMGRLLEDTETPGRVVGGGSLFLPVGEAGAPSGTRTPNPLIRSLRVLPGGGSGRGSLHTVAARPNLSAVAS